MHKTRFLSHGCTSDEAIRMNPQEFRPPVKARWSDCSEGQVRFLLLLQQAQSSKYDGHEKINYDRSNANVDNVRLKNRSHNVTLYFIFIKLQG